MPKAFYTGDLNQPEEQCFLCGSLSGKAGKDEDSLYTNEEGVGPFCDHCWDLVGQALCNEESLCATHKSNEEGLTSSLEEIFEHAYGSEHETLHRIAVIASDAVGATGAVSLIVQDIRRARQEADNADRP